MNCLESERLDYQEKISELEVKTNKFNEKDSKNSGVNIEKLDVEHKKLLVDLNNVNKDIDEKNLLKSELQNKRDELVKKSLIILHSTMKKEYQKADKDHARYVELYTKERAKKHDIERKMITLKMMVYKNYGLRLI